MRGFDVVISGGGVSGLALANILARSPLTKHLSVLVADPTFSQQQQQQQQPSKDGTAGAKLGTRVSFLNYSAARLFSAIGVDDNIMPRATMVHNMEIADCFDAHLRFAARESSEEFLGIVVENDLVAAALRQNLATCDNVKLLAGTVKTITQQEPDSNGDWIRLKTSSAKKQGNNNEDDNEEIVTRLLVGSEGFTSATRAERNIEFNRIEYNQRGVVAALELEHEHGPEKTAFQVFHRYGTIAVLPMFERFGSLVWALPSAKAAAVLDPKIMPAEEFVSCINAELRGLVTVKALVNDRAMFPLGVGVPSSYTDHRFALVGDSAHNVHPLAGQGLNLGLGDAVGLANAVFDAVRSGTDIGARSVLRQYERQQVPINLRMQLTCHALQRSYTLIPESELLGRIVSFGMRTFDRSQLLKGEAIRVAMGHHYNLSSIGSNQAFSG